MKLNLPEVSDTHPQYDFLSIITKVMPEFATTWMVQIQKKEDKEKDITSIYKLIEHFRNYVRLKAMDKPLAIHGVFMTPTFQNQKLDDDGNQDKKEDTKKTCLCGKLHRFKKCWYLIKEFRSSGWKPDLVLQCQIDEKI
jgi:pentatricopeptide repeat protein